MNKFTTQDIAFMRMALDKAALGVRRGQTPFGACIVRKGQVIALEHNCVWQTTDISAHAEVQAIRSACRILKTVDLSDCVIYSTCEPCPMCFSACHWAGLQKIYFGAFIRDAQRAGFNELTISARRMKSLGQSVVTVDGGLLRQENTAFLDAWSARENKRLY